MPIGSRGWEKFIFFWQNALKNNRLRMERRLAGNMKTYDLQVKEIAILIAIGTFVFPKDWTPFSTNEIWTFSLLYQMINPSCDL